MIPSGDIIPKREVFNQFPVSSWIWPRVVCFTPMLAAWPMADEIWPFFNEITRKNGVEWIYEPYGSIDSVRNRAVEQFLKTDHTHILFMDADMKHRPDIVQAFARHVISDPTRLIIAGLYFNRREPYLPLAWARDKDGNLLRLHRWEPGLISGVELVAGGCLFVNRAVFENIPRPWFYHDYEYAERDKDKFAYPSEDIGFCRKAREAGIIIHLDTTIGSLHARGEWVNGQTYEDYFEAHKEDFEDAIVDVEMEVRNDAQV